MGITIAALFVLILEMERGMETDVLCYLAKPEHLLWPR